MDYVWDRCRRRCCSVAFGLSRFVCTSWVREKESGECVRMHKFEQRKLVCCARRILDVVVIKYSHWCVVFLRASSLAGGSACECAIASAYKHSNQTYLHTTANNSVNCNGNATSLMNEMKFIHTTTNTFIEILIRSMRSTRYRFRWIM